jgi:two-component system, NtrC family, nitrogen regulation sensor histidine kinase NtrY
MWGQMVSRTGHRSTWERFIRLRRQKRVQNATTFGLVFLGPVLAVATFLALGPFNQAAASPFLRLILLSDLVYILVVAALVLSRVARIVADRRSQSAGSRLHLRLSGVFAIVALIPTVIVAIFAVLTVNFGLEGWFSERVRSVVGSSLSAAEAYEAEHRGDLIADAEALAGYLNVAKQSTFFLEDGQLRPILTQGQTAIQRGLKEAFLIDGAGVLKTRGEQSYLFDFETPLLADIARAETGETVVIPDW